MSDEIRIYVADLAAYNNGKLHGVWIDACDELDDIQEQINTMLKNSPEDFAEEYAIHDYEGFSGYRLGQYEGIEPIHEIACFIDENLELGAELLNHFSDIDEAKKSIEENYCGCYRALADYAQQLSEETTEIPSHLEIYIDYERMGHDMEISGDIFTIATSHKEIHVFWSH